MKAATVASIMLAYKLNKLRKKRIRTIYVRQIFLNRALYGDMVLVSELRNDPFYHHKYFRMNKSSFDELFNLVKQKLVHPNCHARPIDPMTRFSMTLRYLAAGHSQVSIAMSYRVSPSSVRLILNETLEALSEALSEHLKPPSVTEFRKIAKEFEERWHFPLCAGAIDGKHIRVTCPARSGTQFFNYKDYFSVVLIAVVDANYKFTLVDIGRSGSLSDSGILLRSAIGAALDSETLLPEKTELGKTRIVLPHFLLGDGGFPLKPNLMRPYSSDQRGEAERTFNYRLSRARMVSEYAFGILAARWRIFHTAIIANRDFVQKIILCCVSLHNYLRTKCDNVISADVVSDTGIVPGNWGEADLTTSRLADLGRQGSQNYSTDASVVREHLKNYFMQQGALSWQHDYFFFFFFS